MGMELTLPAALRCGVPGKFRMHKVTELLCNPRYEEGAKAADTLSPNRQVAGYLRRQKGYVVVELPGN